MSNHDREGSHPSNRDATLERAWREASDEQPPARLDAAIVAAARQSVADRGQQPAAAPPRPSARNWVARWQPLAAAASVAALAFVLVQTLPREQSRAPLPQRQESAPIATAAEPQPQLQDSPAREVTDDSPVSSTRKAVGARERVDLAVDVPAQHAVPVSPPVPAPPAAKAAASASDSAGLVEDSSAERSLGNAAPLDATAWAAKIATLHAAGDFTAAEHALRAFRAAEPDADTYLPESLRDWARSVQ